LNELINMPHPQPLSLRRGEKFTVLCFYFHVST
jgi:hypothetical protein